MIQLSIHLHNANDIFPFEDNDHDSAEKVSKGAAQLMTREFSHGHQDGAV